MCNTDIITIWTIHIFLVLFLISYVFANLRSSINERSGHLQKTVTRGQESMNLLYIFYGVVSLVYALSIQVAECGQYHKATLIVSDYIVLTYLFFFNGKFRNMIIGIYIRLKKD
jgi:hypothetical protein